MKPAATLSLAIALTLTLTAAAPQLPHAFAQQNENASAELAAFHVEPPFAWNRTDRYAPPDFAAFFPDDAEGGRQLDLFLEGRLPLTDAADRLALIRRGLRHTSHHRTTLLGRVGNEFVWTRDSQDSRAIELLYHASASPDPGVAHYALYHGPTVVSGRTPNLVRMLMELYHSFDREIQGRIPWGMQRYGDREHTRRLLLDLLDDHETLGDSTIAAAIDTYQAVFVVPPPDIERFAGVGTWVIAFHRTDLSADHPRAAEIQRATLDHVHFRNPGLRLVDFVTRVDDGRETSVALVQGLASRTDLVAYLARRKHHHIDFNELLAPRVLQERRLREFARHLPDGLPPGALPAYTRPPADASYAHRADRFVAPDFEAFFADDPAAAAQLDQVYERVENRELAPMAAQPAPDLSDRELLELFRRGVRRSAHTPNAMFGWISGALGWPDDPRLTEIFYHGLDPAAPQEVRKAAVYYGFGLGTPKTANVLQALAGVFLAPPFDRTTNGNMRSRILWSVHDHEDDKHALAGYFAAALRDHASLSDIALVQVDIAFRELTGAAPPNAADYADRGLFLVAFRAPAAATHAESKQQVTSRLGDSEHVLETRFIETDGRVVAWVLVRGTPGRQWLLEKLREKPSRTILFADLLTHELIDQVEQPAQDVLREFEKHLRAVP